MNRRELLQRSAAFTAAFAMPRIGVAAPAFAPSPGAWRGFEIVTRLTIAAPQGATQAWIPLPSVNEDGWFRSLGSSWTTATGEAAEYRDPRYGAALLHVTWKAGETAPSVEVTSRIATRDRAVDLARPAGEPRLSDAERQLHLAATELIPTDGIVKATSDTITAGKATDLEKAQAIYQWIVDNTFRDPATRGCGVGDIAAMLESGNLGGKCADLNALFVGLARAAGLPARDIYGLRVAPSAFGYKALGANAAVVTKAQHCRAEVFLAGLGWVPVDPADVRKVILEEPPGKLAADDPKVVAVREKLFGAWEGNWLAYNVAHDIALPGAAGPKVGFLMYPQAETAAGRLDCLDPERFAYTIEAREVAA